jgi:hypothetical protein
VQQIWSLSLVGWHKGLVVLEEHGAGLLGNLADQVGRGGGLGLGLVGLVGLGYVLAAARITFGDNALDLLVWGEQVVSMGC